MKHAISATVVAPPKLHRVLKALEIDATDLDGLMVEQATDIVRSRLNAVLAVLEGAACATVRIG